MLEEIVIPGSVKRIDNYAFKLCASLRQITFAGKGLETIGYDAFACSGLRSFTAPSSLRTIGSIAFANCRDLKQVDLSACTSPASGTEDFVSCCAFEDSTLESISLPPTLRVIGDRAFAGCKHLK